MSLHDELHQLADTADRPVPDPSIWDRGRALRRRDRLVMSAVVVALVLIVGGLTSLVVSPPRAGEPADTTVPGGAIPSAIRDLPTNVTGPLEGSDGICLASAAFIASNGTPVVIGAADGKYHLLDLGPGIIALSPSGEEFAFVSGNGEMRMVIVRSLLHREVLAGYDIGAGTSVQELAWSPDGKWLAYAAMEPNGDALSGRWRYPDGGELRGPSSHRSITGLAVSNDGLIALGTQSGGLIIGSLKGPNQFPRADGRPAAFSPDGTLLAVSDTLIPTVASTTVQLSTGKAWPHPFPSDTFGPSTIRPVGWLDDRLQLLLVQERSDEPAEFVITTPKVDQTSTWRRGVGSVDPTIASTLTVAVDLIPDLDGTSSQQLTHDFGEPEWPGPDTTPWLIGLGIAGALIVLVGLARRWRRRTELL